MADPRDFLLNTDYEMDKIILVKTGSFVRRAEIPHDLGFAPLPFGVWSTSEDFSTVNTIGVSDYESYPGYTPRLGVDCASYSDKIKLAASGDGKDTTTIYYRLYGFEPPESSADVTTNSTMANTFVLNTDYNYRKLMAQGTFTQDYQEYAHNLGYIPQVMAWLKASEDWGGDIEPIMGASNYNDFKISLTANKIIAGNVISSGVEKIYWRIYYDEA